MCHKTSPNIDEIKAQTEKGKTLKKAAETLKMKKIDFFEKRGLQVLEVSL